MLIPPCIEDANPTEFQKAERVRCAVSEAFSCDDMEEGWWWANNIPDMDHNRVRQAKRKKAYLPNLTPLPSLPPIST
jgi:hypothetical protein